MKVYIFQLFTHYWLKLLIFIIYILPNISSNNYANCRTTIVKSIVLKGLIMHFIKKMQFFLTHHFHLDRLIFCDF
jgi:hypothetical protein